MRGSGPKRVEGDYPVAFQHPIRGQGVPESDQARESRFHQSKRLPLSRDANVAVQQQPWLDHTFWKQLFNGFLQMTFGNSVENVPSGSGCMSRTGFKIRIFQAGCPAGESPTLLSAFPRDAPILLTLLRLQQGKGMQGICRAPHRPPRCPHREHPNGGLFRRHATLRQKADWVRRRPTAGKSG